MPIIKQKTVNGTTLYLKRRQTNREGKQYEYLVTEEGGGRVDEVVFTKQEGLRQLRETVELYKKADDAESQQRGFGFTGGASPTFHPPGAESSNEPMIPGMGGQRSDDDDDDDAPSLPFL